MEQTDAYMARHASSIESALSHAVTELCAVQPKDPFSFLAQQLQAHGVSLGELQAEPAQTTGMGVEPDAPIAGTWTPQAWVSSLPLAPQVVGALLDGAQDDGDSLLTLRTLGARLGSAEALAEHLRAGQVATRLAKELFPALVELADVGPAQGGELQSKFAGAIELSYSGLEALYGGLEGRIGEPQAAVFETMLSEHQKRADSTCEFTTVNYGICTTSALEWHYVVEPFTSKDTLARMGRDGWASEAQDKLPDRSLCRQPEPLEIILARCKDLNARLATQGQPLVEKCEVVAARLYTGPLYVKYNAVLRGLHSDSPFLRNSLILLCCAADVARGYLGSAKQHEKANGKVPWASALAQCNKYITTLHATNSCIVKTGKLTKCSKVFRGMSGMALPDKFWQANEFGIRGGVENGFMSTTLAQHVAMGYASGSNRAGLVFEISMGMIDRGADISWLSQYPHEKEILFGPLTGIEVQRTRVSGAVVVIEARLSVNLNALTIEQVISKMLRSHVSLLDSLLDKLRFAGSPESCLQPLLDVRAQSTVRGREFFNEPSLFLDATKEALDAKHACVEKLGQLENWEPTGADQPPADHPPPEVLAARLRRAAELLASENKNERASKLLMRAAEVAPPPADAVADIDALCMEKLMVPSQTERSALLALDFFLRFSGESALSFPWPSVVRWLALRAGDQSGSGMAYAVTKAAHVGAPGAIVKPQFFAGDATAKARKGSALLHAASMGDQPAVEEALALVGNQGVDGTMENGVTPLMLACRVGKLGPVRVLLDAGANPNLKSSNGCNALANAAVQLPEGREWLNQPAVVVEALLSKSADVNIGHPALESSGAECVGDASEAKQIPRKNIGLNYPLLAAVTRGSKVAMNVLALLRAGADANARDGFNMTALHHVVRGDNGTNFMVLMGDATFPTEYKIDDPSWPGSHSLDLNVADHHGGWTPLTYAIANGSKRMTKALIDAGAKVDALLPGQLALPLHVAADSGKVGLVKLCLEAKADVNQRGLDKASAIAIGAPYASGRELDELIDVPGGVRSTALLCAALAGHAEVVKLLLEHGADATIADEGGMKPIMVATLGNHTEVASLLLSKGEAPWDMMSDGFPREARRLGFRRALRAGASVHALPESLGECKLLEVLNLNGCVDLPRLPESIGDCLSLREITCRGCKALTVLPSTLGHLQKLEVLDLTGCAALTSLPATLRQCGALRSLSVTGCEALTEQSDVELIAQIRAPQSGSTN